MVLQLGTVYTVKWTVYAPKQGLVDSCLIDVCSRSSSNAPESMRREPQLSKIMYVPRVCAYSDGRVCPDIIRIRYSTLRKIFKILGRISIA